MKKSLLCILITLVILFSTTPITYSNESMDIYKLSDMQAVKNLELLPLSFTENRGQWNDHVQFLSNSGGAMMWFASDGAYYQFTRTIKSVKFEPFADVTLNGVEGLRQSDSIETMMIKANFMGANLNPQMVGVDKINYKCNYFIGNDKSKWATDVPNYSAVMYEEIYDGIDLKYYGNGTQIEYDFIVSPGADYSQIKVQYEGAESIAVNDNGELVVTTKWGDVVEQRPVIYQIENNSRIPIDGNYILQNDNSFSFELSSYNSSLPLVIDPVLTYSTYLGGSGDESGYGIAVDASGDVYITGSTSSTDFPSLNPYTGTLPGTEAVFVTKLSSVGNSLVYSTYIGGTGADVGYDIAVDDFGSAYIVGRTNSTDFPTLNPYQVTYQGGFFDAFITKLNSAGDSLIYSTYLGGSDQDRAGNITVGASGVAYVVGSTKSTDFPTVNPYIGTAQGGVDVFVTKLSSGGDSLLYSTYLGGSSDDYGSEMSGGQPLAEELQ